MYYFQSNGIVYYSVGKKYVRSVLVTDCFERKTESFIWECFIPYDAELLASDPIKYFIDFFCNQNNADEGSSLEVDKEDLNTALKNDFDII